MLLFSAFIITRDEYLQSSEYLQLLIFIKKWYHWCNPKTSYPFYFRVHFCTHGPTSQLCSSTIYYDSSKFCQMSLDFATLPKKISAKFQFLQVLLEKKKPTRLLSAYSWFSITTSCRSQHSLSEQGSWAATALEPYSCVLDCHRTPNITTATQFLFISLLFVVLGCGRSLSKGSAVMDIKHQEQQFCCCSPWAD